MVLGFRLLFIPPLFPVDIRDADRRGQSSLPLGDHTEFGDLKFPAPECLLMIQVCLAPDRNAGGLCCTTQQRNTHNIESREVRYPWHPWCDRVVAVHQTFAKNGRVVSRCRVDETRKRDIWRSRNGCSIQSCSESTSTCTV